MSVTDIVFGAELISVAVTQRHNWWVLSIENVPGLCHLLDSTYICFHLTAQRICLSQYLQKDFV